MSRIRRMIQLEALKSIYGEELPLKAIQMDVIALLKCRAEEDGVDSEYLKKEILRQIAEMWDDITPYVREHRGLDS